MIPLLFAPSVQQFVLVLLHNYSGFACKGEGARAKQSDGASPQIQPSLWLLRTKLDEMLKIP